MKQTRVTNFFLLLIFAGIAAFLLIGYIIVNYKYIGNPCGGFGANLPEYQCPVGLRCVSEASHPDAGGNCQYIWPLSLVINKPQSNYSPENVLNYEFPY